MTQSADFRIRPIEASDHSRINEMLSEKWGSTRMVSRGRMFEVTSHPGYVAVQGDRLVGLITYEIDGGECEITVLESLVEGLGIGSALIDAVKQYAKSQGCRRLWLVTTNDNIHAFRFYQRRGFLIAAVHINALEESRKIKPEIPLTGNEGIPLRDEIEFELLL